MFSRSQPKRPTGSKPSMPHVTTPNTQLPRAAQYDVSSTHPVFFTDRLRKPSPSKSTEGGSCPKVAGAKVETKPGSGGYPAIGTGVSGDVHPAAEGYVWRDPSGSLKL